MCVIVSTCPSFGPVECRVSGDFLRYSYLMLGSLGSVPTRPVNTKTAREGLFLSSVNVLYN